MKSITESLKILDACRQSYLKFINGYDIDAVNHIPTGFNNNIVWNFGHVLATQQLLIYGLSGAPLHMDKTLINKYKKGTKPEGKISQGEIDELKDIAFVQIDQLAKDYENGLFQNFNPYQTSFGITLESVNEAIEFNNVHEGMHIGSCLAIKKFLV